MERHSAGDPATQQRLDEVTRAWHRHTLGTLAQISAMAAVYELPERGLLTAVLDTYQCSLDDQ